MALVQYAGMNVLSCGTIRGDFIRILPGINELEANDLESILKLPSIKARVESGLLKIIDDGKSSGKKSVDETLAMIPRIVDKKLLNKLIKTDGRPQVVEAAKNQLALIEMKVEDKPKAQNDEQQHFN